jgi:transcriptional regulator with XRE-family HTH domain
MTRDLEAWARLGVAIRSERERYGWSREQLARAASVSVTAVQNAERGRVPIRRWPQTIARVERSLGWHPGTAKAVIEGGTPDSPPFPLEIMLIEDKLRRSVWVEISDGDAAAAAGATIEEWWRIISRISPPVRVSAKTLAHIALALHIDDKELTVAGRADAAHELRALPFTIDGARIPQLSEDDPRFSAFLAIARTFADAELKEAVRFLGFKVPAYDDDYLMKMLLTLVEYDANLPE